MLAERILLLATSQLRRIDARSSRVERILRLDLNANEIDAVRQSCRRSNERLGAYYHWYLQKLLLAGCLRRIEGNSLLNRLRTLDSTNYDTLSEHIDDDSGLLVAIPHFGHYILSILGIAEHLRRKRQVQIFYGSPLTHPGNDLFDRLYSCLYGKSEMSVRVIHDNKSGMATALRGLREGAVVIIIPDVARSASNTYTLPFCGRTIGVMLGTATLARKTGARIVPAVSTPRAFDMRFSTSFLPAIHPANAPIEGYDTTRQASQVHRDYRTTNAIFRAYEHAFGKSIMYWQFCRALYLRNTPYPSLDPSQADRLADCFLDDPRVRLPTQAPIQLD